MRISLNQVPPGARLAKAIFDMDGKMLLNTGVELDDALVTGLRERGVSEVVVHNRVQAALQLEDAVSDASRIEALAAAHACVEAVESRRSLPVGRVSDAIEGVADDVRRSRGKTIAVSPARTGRDWWEAHAVNVALLATAMAVTMNLERAQVVQAGVGALLHDIGLLGLSGAPFTAETEALDGGRGHPVLGFQSLLTNARVSAGSAVVCLQHHERLDGSGFPKGMSGSSISLQAQICATADAYDGLIAAAAFGSGELAHNALRHIAERRDLASEAVRDAFAHMVAPYPTGTVLRLRDGGRALVTEAAPVTAATVARAMSDTGEAADLIELIGDRLSLVLEVV